MQSTSCAEVEAEGTEFERLDRQLAELDRLIEDGRAVGDIRIDRRIELGQLEADAGNVDDAYAAWDELLAELAGRSDRDGLGLAVEVWARRADRHAVDRQHQEAADAYGHAYELASQAVTSWPQHRDLAAQFVGVARGLGRSTRELGHYDSSLAAYDKALIVCGRFLDDLRFVRLDAEVSVQRADAIRAARRPVAEALPWFDRAIAKHALLDDPAALSAIWHARGSFQLPAKSACADYLRAIELIEPLLPDLDTASRISRSSHNIALVLRDAPADALPHESRAVELMYDVLEQRGSDEDRYDLLFYRLTRADLMARSGAQAAAIEEVREVLPSLAQVVERMNHERGAKLLADYRGHLERWTLEVAQRTPACYRTLPPPATIPADSLRCTFCRRARAEVSKLISGPHVFICNHCVVVAAAALPPAQAHAVGPLVSCRFCGVQRQRFVGTSDGVICDDCLDLCGGILEESIAESHPDLRCSFCGDGRADVDRLVLGPDATALCGGCFTRVRGLLARHHPYDPALGRRRGTRETQFDVCGWCNTREALMFAHGELVVLCDACIDHTAQDMV